MKKYMLLLLSFVSLFFISCGHNVQNNAKGIGI